VVPEDKLDAARLGFELFDTPNWAGSDFTEKVNYQRALEGELERTLGTLNEVEAVRVHLVLPEESLFTESEHEAKATVILKTKSGRLSEQAQQAIPQLVASAVDRLKPENVTVVDADSNLPLLHTREGRIYAPDEELAKTLVETLEPVVGLNHVRASVHVEYDPGTSEDTQETFDPKTPIPLTEEHSEENSTGETPAGVPASAAHLQKAQSLRRLLAAYVASEDLVRIGAYQKGSDSTLDKALTLVPELDHFLMQKPGESAAFGETVEKLMGLPG
jgi:flagellar M-ring protein FliF